MRRIIFASLASLWLAVPASAQDFRAPVLGEWTGKYICAQGITGLTLTVSAGGPGMVEAVFHFGPVPENPDLPEGAYRLRGFYIGPTRSLMLQADEWIDAPAGYVMVDMRGRVNARGDRLSGTIPMMSCSVFELVRSIELIG